MRSWSASLRMLAVTCTLLAGGCSSDGELVFGIPREPDDEAEADAASGGSAGGNGQGGDPTTGGGGDPTGSGETGPATTAVTTSVTSSGVTTGGGPEVSFPCGTVACSGGDVCCVAYVGDELHCAPEGQCGQTHYQIECNNQLDCDGNDVCCGFFDAQFNSYVAVECVPTCQGTSGTYGLLMCEDDPGVCQGQSCNDSESLPDGYSYCGQ